MNFKKLRELRKSKHITLEELGEKTGYSASFLSQIERGLNRPSIEALRKISEALGIPAASLFSNEAVSIQSEQPSGEGYTIVRNNEHFRYNPWEKNATYYETLFNVGISHSNLIISKIFIDSQSSASGKKIAHNLTEINYVLKGTATIELSESDVNLNEGDAIYLEPFTQHNISNNTEDGLILLTLQF